jgi:hypothetical protein
VVPPGTKLLIAVVDVECSGLEAPFGAAFRRGRSACAPIASPSLTPS